MAKDETTTISPEPGWKMLLELIVPSRQHVVEQIVSAVRGLGMAPAQAGRVEQAATAALKVAMGSSGCDCHAAAVAIRIWTCKVPATSPLLPVPGAREQDLEKNRGWGFFVVQRREGDEPTAARQMRHLVDVYLYEEG